MDRFSVALQGGEHANIEAWCASVTRQLRQGYPNGCPIELASAAVRLLQCRSCGKCTPCRVGLEAIATLLLKAAGPDAAPSDRELIAETAQVVIDTADCAIGIQAAQIALDCAIGSADDFRSHVEQGRCGEHAQTATPCVAECPANVDVPGYIALLLDDRPEDAVRLIRKDNPLPLSCGLVCEHPCESYCRRGLVDDPVSIRELKRAAVEKAGFVSCPEPGKPTGKRVAVVGGGPAGLTCAYYLRLMGHAVTLFEKQPDLGGMLRYGIPSYRLPKDELSREIAQIVDLGIEVHTNTCIGSEIPFVDVQADFDAVYLAIGAQSDKKLRIEGEDASGVISAVEMLRDIANGEAPDFSHKNIAVVGGGNVAMDAARSAVRLGAKSVSIVYRRRRIDMTAQEEEVLGAIAEGCEIIELHAPVSVVADERGVVRGLETAPQIIGRIENGRAKPRKAACDPRIVDCDIVVVAIGQSIESAPFEDAGVPTRWGQVVADGAGRIEGMPAAFSGGDCVTGPSTVIMAIAAGKAAAGAIDGYLGFNHPVSVDVRIPDRIPDDTPTARIDPIERPAAERSEDFEIASRRLTDEEIRQEAARCLRCDCNGCGSFEAERSLSW